MLIIHNMFLKRMRASHVHGLHNMGLKCVSVNHMLRFWNKGCAHMSASLKFVLGGKILAFIGCALVNGEGIGLARLL